MSGNIFRDKRSQITIFIILGIVLLIGGVVYFSFFYDRGEIVPEGERAVEVPLEVKPIQDFVESCAYEIGVDALRLAGQHGGYIDPLDARAAGRSFDIDPLDPTGSDGVSITEDAESGVVYWWYMKSPDVCYDCLITDENIPDIEEIERQVDVYVVENLPGCLDGFASFESAGFEVTELGQLEVTTRVTEDDVVVSLDFPLRAVLAGKSTDIGRFITHIPVDLRRIYGLAEKIAMTEGQYNFFEYVTKSWISINGGLHTDQLPPTYAIEESYVPKIWIRDVVELQLKGLLTSYVSLLQVNETKGAEPLDIGVTDVERGLYRSFFLNLLGEDYGDYSVRFMFLDWPIYLHITPDDQGILRAARVTDIEMMVSGLTPFVPMVPQNEYEFFYDLSYPVVVELRNDEDLFGEGFTWLFAMEVNLRDNRGVQEWFEGNGTYGPWDYSWFNVDVPTEEIAMVRGGDNLSLVRQNYTKSLFCSPKQRLSGNITVKVLDFLDGDALEGVSVKYSCGKYDSCQIGRTQFDLEENDTVLMERFPVCMGGGIIQLEKKGYKTENIIDLTTLPGEEAEFEFEMMPIISRNVSLKKLPLERVILYRTPLEDHGNNYTRLLELGGGSVDPNFDEETIIVNIRKVDEPSPPAFRAQNLIVSNMTAAVPLTIDLVPGTYEVQTTYIDSGGYTIEPERRCKDGDENCMFIPEEPGVSLDQVIGGGLVLNEETGYWKIDYSDIFSGDTVLFKVLQLPPPVVIEDLNDMSLSENLSAEFRTVVQPEFI